MSNQKHTPEPWQQLLPWAIATTQEDAGFERIVAKTLHHPSFADDESHANAARIVACVNYCKGTPNEELEAGSLEQLKAERDELMEACNAILEVSGTESHEWPWWLSGAIAKVKSAVEKSKGGQP